MTPIKTSADKIVEKHKRFHYGRRERTMNLLALGHAIIEVEACIELSASFGTSPVFLKKIDYYQSLLTELKSRIV